MTSSEVKQLIDEYTATMAKAAELHVRLMEYFLGVLAGSGSGSGSGSASTSSSP